jgi:uncharacterized protein
MIVRKQHWLTLAVLLVAAVGVSGDDQPKEIDPSGLWFGTLKAGAIDLRLGFKIELSKEDAKKLTGKLVSLDQGMAEIPCDTVTFAAGKLTLDLPKGGIAYTAQLDKNGAFTGEFKQSGMTFPLKIERVEKWPSLKRPQLPKDSDGYKSSSVKFENATAKIQLAGTLTVPNGDGPFPAVVLISGSGPQDRDETLFGHKPFLVIADHLARQGIACLRYDDRGVAESGGQFAEATSADFATDTYAALKFLRADPRIDPKRVGLCGHSEGGLIAPLVAVEHPTEVAFLVLLAGPGISGERVMQEQAMDFSKIADEKVDEKEVKESMDAVLPVLKTAKTTDDAKKQLKRVLEQLILKEKDAEKRKQAEAATPLMIEQYASAWFRWFVKYDPAPTLESVTCPVLALNGEKDLQVKPKQNLEVIESALKKGGNKAFQCVELKGLNHLFQTCKTSRLDEYGQIEETFSPDALKQISNWIRERK